MATNVNNTTKKILIIDDEPETLEWVLKTYGYSTDVATDGLEGINTLKNGDYDLAIIDLIMPTMTGWKVLEKIRSLDKIKTMPIIILTAFNTNQNQATSLKNGADDYISKPFEVSTLIARIESLFRRTDWGKNCKCTSKTDVKPKKNLLTSRQIQIIDLIRQGHSNKIIATKLYLSETTVKAHLRTIFKKLKVTNRTQAVLECIKFGLLKE
ncbi:MAG: response regulator [Vampirovibrionia bacterium]